MQGIVTKSTGSWYTVKTENGLSIDCKIKGKFRIKGIRTTNPVAVGDHVDVRVEDDEKTGLITKITPRKNYIIRRSINLSKESHIIAANVDLAHLFITIKHPETTTTFIDRFLASAEAYRIPVHLVFNKIDLYNEEDQYLMAELIALYSDIGYEWSAISATRSKDLTAIKNKFKNKVSVLSGHSGAGKSTLINKLYPGTNLKTGDISDYHSQGKHTTAFSEMYELEDNTFIIDTPGIKGFGTVDMQKEEIYHFFPEIFKVSNGCQYNNCQHIHEPNCAVKDAVESGEIAASRYNSYLNMLEEDDGKYRVDIYK